MSEYIISLADIHIGVSDLYPSTKTFFKDYLSEKTPEFYVTTSIEDIETERELSKLQNEREGLPVQNYSDAYLETLAIHRKISTKMIDYDVVLLHGSAVALNGKAYIFTAMSGTGKTTHTRLWLNLFPDAYVLNGDKPFLRYKDGKTYACGSPWQGKEHYGTNEILPLEAICILERDKENSITPISFNNAIKTLLQQMHRPDGADGLIRALKICEKIGNSVKLYNLKCNMEPEAALVSRKAMLGVSNE